MSETNEWGSHPDHFSAIRAISESMTRPLRAAIGAMHRRAKRNSFSDYHSWSRYEVQRLANAAKAARGNN
jgi:hypothetical protein